MSRCCAKPTHAAMAQPPSTSGVVVPQEAMESHPPLEGEGRLAVLTGYIGNRIDRRHG
jgi:hypothetical protein